MKTLPVAHAMLNIVHTMNVECCFMEMSCAFAALEKKVVGIGVLRFFQTAVGYVNSISHSKW